MKDNKRKLLSILALIMLFPILAGCTKEKMEVINKDIVVEYGENIPTAAKDYLKNDEDFLKDVKVENVPENEKDKEYPAVGEYEIILKSKNQEEKVKVIVKDTIAPEFVDLKEKYEVVYNSKLETKEFKATDLSEVAISLDDTKVDYKKAADYKVIVIAKDTSNNETKKEITLTVKEEVKKEEKKDITSTSKKNTNTTSTTNKQNNTTSSGTTSTKPNNANDGSSSSNASVTQAKPVNPANCTHRGIKVVEDRWFNSDDELDEWVFSPECKYTGAYGGTECPDCGKIGINGFRSN